MHCKNSDATEQKLNEIHEFFEEFVQNLQQHFSQDYRFSGIKLLENCKHLSEFCTWNELDLCRFKADLLESIEVKLRSICNLSNYFENNHQKAQPQAFHLRIRSPTTFRRKHR